MTGELARLNYLLMDGVNDDDTHAHALVERLRGRPFLLKVSELNDVDEIDVKGSSPERMGAFTEICRRGGLELFTWQSMGVGIGGGCGPAGSRRRTPSNRAGNVASIAAPR
jgi:23S rRNA (adenine2503-C2)-methyltransferase